MKERITLHIAGMTCAGCVATLTRWIQQLSGILAVDISFTAHRALITYDRSQVTPSTIIAHINATGKYTATEVGNGDSGHSHRVRHIQQPKPSATEAASTHYQLIIIGGGSAAFGAAIEANRLGIRTLMINAGLPIGGTCVNVGCIPSKFLVQAAHQIAQMRSSHYAGIQPGRFHLSYPQLQQHLQQLVSRLRREKYENIVQQLDAVHLHHGWATFRDPHTIEVGNQQFTADFFILATGSLPAIPPIEGMEYVQFFTNETIFDLSELPSSLAIIGGGYVGVELGQAFARFGAQVQIIEMQPTLLPTEAPDIGQWLQQRLAAEGIHIYTGAKVQRVWMERDTIHLQIQTGDTERQLLATHLLVATGRRGRTQQLQLSRIGVHTDSLDRILVNEYLQSTVPHIYAAGDCNIYPAFVYTAAAEGRRAVRNIFIPQEREPVDYTSLPWVVFTDPQIAGIGIDELEAQRQGIPYEKAELPLSEVPRAQVSQTLEGFIRLLRDPQTDRLLGARIIAPSAGDLITELQLAMQHRLSIADLINTWHPYLTFAEGIKLAALTFEHDLHQLSCCAV